MCGALHKHQRVLAGFSRIRHSWWKCAISGVVACLVMLAPMLGVAMGEEQDTIFSLVRAYTAAAYARDYAEAYRWIAAENRRLKSLPDYEQDHDP